MNKDTNIYKIVLLGQFCSGKSSLINMYCNDKFNEYTESTIGAAYFTKFIEEKNIKLEYWDTAGQERYDSLCSLYYKNTGAAIILFDITNLKSFDKSKFWINQINNFNPDIYITLVGNKCDLDNDRKISFEEAKNYAEENNIYYIETSAKENKNINELMENIVNNISPVLNDNKSIEISQILNKNNKSCCY